VTSQQIQTSFSNRIQIQQVKEQQPEPDQKKIKDISKLFNETSANPSQIHTSNKFLVIEKPVNSGDYVSDNLTKFKLFFTECENKLTNTNEKIKLKDEENFPTQIIKEVYSIYYGERFFIYPCIKITKKYYSAKLNNLLNKAIHTENISLLSNYQREKLYVIEKTATFFLIHNRVQIIRKKFEEMFTCLSNEITEFQTKIEDSNREYSKKQLKKNVRTKFHHSLFII
jgi:hypothetical protein